MPRRNPAPLSGALFIRNPRRNKRRNAGRGFNQPWASRFASSPGLKRRKRKNALAYQENRRRNVSRLLNRIRNTAKRNHRRNALALQTNSRWNPRRNSKIRNRKRNLKTNRARRNKMRNRKRNRGLRNRRRNAIAFKGRGGRGRGFGRGGLGRGRFMKRRGLGKGRARFMKRGRRRNRNTGLVQTVTGSTTRLVRMIPFIGPKTARYVTPALIGGASFVPVHFGLQYVGPYIPAYLKPVAYTTASVLVATAASMIPRLTKPFKRILGTTMVAAGAAMDMSRYFAGTSQVLGDRVPAELLSGLAYDYEDAYGDGMAYDIAGLGIDLGSASILDDYSDSQMADAYYSGGDLSAAEGDAALRGAPSWRKQFLAPPVIARQEVKAVSRHAGRPGHRWGWVVKLLGWENFRKLAALPPAQRCELIAKLRADAVASVQEAHDTRHSAGETAGLALDLSGLSGQIFAGAAY